jgi:gas vesicle protein
VPKWTSWLIGFALGAGIGVALVMLFSPVSGDQLIARLRQGWQQTLAEARKANAERRAELEHELAQMKRPAPPRQ